MVNNTYRPMEVIVWKCPHCNYSCDLPAQWEIRCPGCKKDFRFFVDYGWSEI